MINGNFTSVGEILWRVTKHPIMQDVSFEEAAEHALHFIKILQIPFSMRNEVFNVTIEEHKGFLPKNIVTINQVKYTPDCDSNCEYSMTYASNSFHPTSEIDDDYSYTIQDCVITTSKKDGVAIVSAKVLVLDENGFPMIPDNESFKMALEYYVVHRHLETLWALGKVPDKVFQYFEQKRHFYVGQAENSMKIANMDHAQTLANGINRIIINTLAHDNFYKNFGTREYIKRYN